MSVLFRGGCACGAIRYECSAEPLLSEFCYCRDCQRSSGNASAALLFVPIANFILTIGSPKYYRVMGTSGFPLDRGFCPECGSPMVVKPHRAPDLIIIAAASLDDPSRFRPQVEMWTRSAPPWACLHPTVLKIPGQATAEERDALLALAPRLASFSRCPRFSKYRSIAPLCRLLRVSTNEAHQQAREITPISRQTDNDLTELSRCTTGTAN